MDEGGEAWDEEEGQTFQQDLLASLHGTRLRSKDCLGHSTVRFEIVQFFKSDVVNHDRETCQDKHVEVFLEL